MNDYIPPQMMCEMKIEYAGGAGILLVNDCCLTPIQQCSALSWPEQDNFQWDEDEVRFVRWVGFLKY